MITTVPLAMSIFARTPRPFRPASNVSMLSFCREAIAMGRLQRRVGFEARLSQVQLTFCYWHLKVRPGLNCYQYCEVCLGFGSNLMISMALQAMKEIDIDDITPFHQNQGEETQRLLPGSH